MFAKKQYTAVIITFITLTKRRNTKKVFYKKTCRVPVLKQLNFQKTMFAT